MADDAVTPANVLAYSGATTAKGIAAVAITAGQTLYLNGDGELALAIDTSAAAAACVGVALCNADPGQPLVYLTSGGLNPGAAVTVGLQYGVTDTAGGIGLLSERGAADYITLIGIATTTSRIEVEIQASGVPIT